MHIRKQIEKFIRKIDFYLYQMLSNIHSSLLENEVLDSG